jgi:tetratricopeptide (TPR) repeat protein
MLRTAAPDEAAAELPPPADDFRTRERTYVREERWEDLAALLIEHAENVAEGRERALCLMRASLTFQDKLDDPDRAFIAMLAAFQESPAEDEVANGLSLMASANNRWSDLLAECNSFVTEAPASKRAEVLLAMSRWYQSDLGDSVAAEQSLEGALAADPANPAALRALVDLCGQRGEWTRAAAYLVAAASSAADLNERVDLSLEAAEIFQTKLADADAAAEQYHRVLQLQPNHPRAIEALITSSWEKQDWATVLPLLEMAVADGAVRSPEETARLHQRAGWAAQMLGDEARARNHYHRSHAVRPDYLPNLLCWAELALREDWWDDIRTVVPLVLPRAEAQLTPPERIEYLQGLGQAHLELGDAAAAADVLARALDLAPEDRVTRRLLAKTHSKTDGQGVSPATRIDQQRMLLKGAASDDERFDILCSIAEIQREELHDQEGALATLTEAIALRPGDPDVLHELMEIYTMAGHWPHAVEVLRALIETETGKSKARYLVATANILNYELKAGPEAIELYNQALDVEPEDRRSFERIERILTGRSDWRELARNQRRMIKRLGNPPAPEHRAFALSLWQGLAELCRTRMGDAQAAATAYEVCSSLAPDDRNHLEAMADCLESQGEPAFPQAIKAREQLLLTANGANAVAKQIRALARLHSGTRAYDRAFCASAAMVALLKADAQERAFYERNALPGVPLAGAALNETLWQRAVCDGAEDRRLSALFAAIGPSLAVARAREAQAWGIDPSSRVDLTTDRSSVGQILVYASRLTGVPLPAVYVPATAPGELDMVPVRELQHVAASFVLGHDLVGSRTEAELAFTLSRKLVALRPEYFVLWPQLVSSLDELQILAGAAIKLVQPGFDLPGIDATAARKTAASLQRLVSPAQMSALSAVVPQLLAGPAFDLRLWMAGAESTINRAGLVACGNVVAAARELVKEARQRGIAPADAILNLARWSSGPDYMDLREQLGLALVPSDDEARTPPVSA